jgi:hypothetical protein
MVRCSRTRRVLKAVGAVLCGLMVVSAALSSRWHVQLVGDRWRRQLGLFKGGVSVVWDFNSAGPSWGPPGLKVSQANPAAGWSWLPRVMTNEKMPGVKLFGKRVIVPLWIPFLAVAGPTGLLWYRDRRRIPVGHCHRCGYDLTGNVSGRCPECGTPL